MADHDMPDAPAGDGATSLEAVQEGIRQEESIGAPRFDGIKIRVLPGESNTAASFEFMHEDHTLGNALRHIIMRNPDVEFCGYSIPHPSDPKMNLRIQTYDDVSVYDVLEKGLSDLMDLCDVVLEKFEAAKESFPKDQADTSTNGSS